MANKVIAHYLDGTIIKGTSLDVDVDRPICHIRTVDHGVVEVNLTELKALFLVKDLAGSPAHDEGTAVNPNDIRTRGTYRIALKFADGERIVGLTVHYPPVRPFFFVLPVDGESNNLRILINRAAVTSMEQPSASS